MFFGHAGNDHTFSIGTIGTITVVAILFLILLAALIIFFINARKNLTLKNLKKNFIKKAAVASAITFLIVGAIGLLIILVQSNNVALFDPKGSIAAQQRDLMIIVTLLMLIVVMPVFILTFAIAWKFRASNHKARYTPEWDHNMKLEALWWGIPFLIIAILSIIIWISSHQLDPYRPISSDKEPIKIQVVALQWKWLFIYPDHGIATVNHVQFPVDTPLNFEITSDAPMNSFWIPQLGGQVYAMSGMKTRLHLIANEIGDYRGSSANLSGEGFSSMIFVAESRSQMDFDRWVQDTKQSSRILTSDSYTDIAKPGVEKSPISYRSVQDGLYDTIIMKYMTPSEDLPVKNIESGINRGHDRDRSAVYQ